MNRSIIAITVTLFAAIFCADAQVDTAGIYSERKDSLDAAVFVSRQAGNYLSLSLLMINEQPA